MPHANQRQASTVGEIWADCIEMGEGDVHCRRQTASLLLDEKVFPTLCSSDLNAHLVFVF